MNEHTKELWKWIKILIVVIVLIIGFLMSASTDSTCEVEYTKNVSGNCTVVEDNAFSQIFRRSQVQYECFGD
jgi:Ni,Fe-hydrogenase I cytochrome b subunit